MRAHRFIHLLVAATLLFSQIVAGIHMAGHLHAPAAASTVTLDGSQGQTYTDLSCVIYHVYAGSSCVAANPAIVLAGTLSGSDQQALTSDAPLTTRHRLNAIRGPPLFS